MKTISKTGLAICLLATLSFSCKQAEVPAEEAPASDPEATSEIAAPAKDTMRYEKHRKFLRTADLKFKVKNVAQSTDAIEAATAKFGGMVTHTDLHSEISEKQEAKVSLDSARIVTKYTMQNDITIRVPNAKLDTVVKTIAKQIDFLDVRVIKADDVSLQLMANQLTQVRSQQHGKRLVKAIDTKGQKLTQIVAAEDDLATRKEAADNNLVQNLALQDQVDFSTLTLKIYQPETIRSEIVATYDAPRPNIGLQLLEALRSGWYILESLLSVVVQLWSLILLGILAFWLYKKHLNKVKPVI